MQSATYVSRPLSSRTQPTIGISHDELGRHRGRRWPDGLAYAVALLTDRADVEECFQETFVAALKLSRRQPVECWSAALCSIATARGMDRLRSRYRQGGHRPGGASGEASAGRRLSEATSTEASPEQRAVATELSERLRSARRASRAAGRGFLSPCLCGWSHREVGGADAND